VNPTKTDEQIKMPFGLWTRMGPRNHVLGGGPDPPAGEWAIRGFVPPLKCTRLCKQQMTQRHAELQTSMYGTVHHGEGEASG